jgi:hypothetical protein
VTTLKMLRSWALWAGLGVLLFAAGVTAAVVGTTIPDPGLNCVNDSAARIAAWRSGWHRSGTYMSVAGWLALGAFVALAAGVVVTKTRGRLVVLALAGLACWVLFRYVVIAQILHKPPCAGF